VFEHANNTIGIEANLQLGPASELQQLCFGVFEDFTLNKDADIADEFNRLVREKRWNRKQVKYEREWCFGESTGNRTHIIIDDDSSSDNSLYGESDSDSDSDSDWDFVSNAESHTGLSDDSIIRAEGGVALNPTPDLSTTLSTEFEQLAIRHANAVEARANLPVAVSKNPKKPKKPTAQPKKAGKSKKQRRAQALETDFCTFFGSDCEGLEGWQKLCEIVGVSSDLKSVTQYKKVRFEFLIFMEVFLLTTIRH